MTYGLPVTLFSTTATLRTIMGFSRFPGRNREGRLYLHLIPSLIFFVMFTAGCARADDEQVWAALKEGGKVILLRHTQVIIGEGIGRLSPGHCAEEINLTPHGVEQAKRLGEAFRAHGIAIGEVLSSPYCRCLDTGKLAFGHATPVPYLMPIGRVSGNQADANNDRVMQEIRNYHGRANLVMITHDVNISNIVLEPTIPMGEFFVLKPNGSDFDVIGEIQRYAR